MRSDDWNRAGGTVCPKCQQETVYLRPEDGLCFTCARKADEKQDRDERKQAKILKLVKAHNARIDKQRGRR